jgi:hypothetical protein
MAILLGQITTGKHILPSAVFSLGTIPRKWALSDEVAPLNRATKLST